MRNIDDSGFISCYDKDKKIQKYINHTDWWLFIFGGVVLTMVLQI